MIPTTVRQALNRRDAVDIERLLEDVRATDEAGEGQRLVCATCGQMVTEPAQAIEVGGLHEHRLTNPVGLTFRVGCFRGAPGCAVFGDPTDAHSWFPGCFWRYALCRGCGDHLGWAYSGADRFFGLIVNRLRSAGPDREG